MRFGLLATRPPAPSMTANCLRHSRGSTHSRGRLILRFPRNRGTRYIWLQQSGWSPVELGQRFANMGVRYALYTDVTRDGELRGVNVETTAQLARETGLDVIASGGVATLQDVEALRVAGESLEKGSIAGVVIGRALYSGAVDLTEAIQVAAGPQPVEE